MYYTNKSDTGCFIRPVNFIHETRDRWAYAAVFGVLSGTFVNLIFGDSLVQPQNFIDSILRGNLPSMYTSFILMLITGVILFVIMMFIPTVVFALVASVHGKILVISHAIGLIYTFIM